MSMITKAIIPVAGWGTRRLPITKAIEKCMLPIGNRPTIDYVVQDCLGAGITDIYFVVSREHTQLERYYSSNTDLESYLNAQDKSDMLPLVQPPAGVSFHYIVQDPHSSLYGTAYPVWLCREYIGTDEQFLVIMGDQFFYRTDGGSNAADLIHQMNAEGVSDALLGVPVPREAVSNYGIIEKDGNGNYVRIVEKPRIEDAPGNLNNASFYAFSADILSPLDDYMSAHRDGEYMIIDVINTYVYAGHPVRVFEAKGEYLDSGSTEGWLHANQVVSTQS